MSEEEIKEKFEKFEDKFQETVFTLIAKFNEISDGFNRVQEALDFLGKIRIQTAENKQIMSKVEKAYIALERKLRDMSLDGFTFPARAPVEAGATDDFEALLSAPIPEPKLESKSATEPTPKPKPIPAPTPIPQPTPELSPLPTPVIEPQPTSELTPLPQPTPAPKSVPEPQPTSTVQPTHEPQPMPTLSPVPKFESKPELTPVPEPPRPTTEVPIAPMAKSTGVKVDEKGLTIKPAPPKPIQEPAFSGAHSSNATALTQQRVANLMGPQDVWHNLEIDLKLAQNCEQIALSLGLANDNLKLFVRFHKVLFELLKTASAYRRKGSDSIPTAAEKEEILKKVESWKFELR